VVVLIISMGIITENYLQIYPIMSGGNVDTWHNHMYVHCTLYISYNIVVTLLAHLQQF
jgi:hypothetical protein